MEISVKIESDADGYTGRECPACEKYFKIKFGTGLLGDPDCHCPYCNPPRVTIVVASLELKNTGAAKKEICGTLRTNIQGPGSSSAVAA